MPRYFLPNPTDCTTLRQTWILACFFFSLSTAVIRAQLGPFIQRGGNKRLVIVQNRFFTNHHISGSCRKQTQLGAGYRHYAWCAAWVTRIRAYRHKLQIAKSLRSYLEMMSASWRWIGWKYGRCWKACLEAWVSRGLLWGYWQLGLLHFIASSQWVARRCTPRVA